MKGLHLQSPCKIKSLPPLLQVVQRSSCPRQQRGRRRLCAQSPGPAVGDSRTWLGQRRPGHASQSYGPGCTSGRGDSGTVGTSHFVTSKGRLSCNKLKFLTENFIYHHNRCKTNTFQWYLIVSKNLKSKQFHLSFTYIYVNELCQICTWTCSIFHS